MKSVAKPNVNKITRAISVERTLKQIQHTHPKRMEAKRQYDRERYLIQIE
jgi:hypothetical protein